MSEVPKIMNRPTAATFDDLIAAYGWVSASGLFENTAYICRRTGRVYRDSSESGVVEELPKDIDDDSKYIAVPSKRDLDLGNPLVFAFMEEHLGNDLASVEGFFERPGAYGKFKSLLERRGELQHWYEYEERAVRAALEEWVEQNHLPVQR